MRRLVWSLIFVLAAGTLFAQEKAERRSPGRISIIHIDGAIGPATASYIQRAIEEAARNNSQCLIMRLNTPGGLVSSTQEIVQSMLASDMPVVVYVSPSGGGAISAGCFITLASHIAVMAPATNIGAAHPVAGGGQEMDEVMNEKVTNFAVSLIEAIAQQRNRNVEWAKSSVRESKAITSDEALELDVVDFIALDVTSLLEQIDGRTFGDRTLQTAGGQVVEIPMNVGEKFLQMLSHPEVMFILMLIAMYGIIGELSNPGAIVPGVAGAIALILMLYMGSIIPMNVAGFAMIALAVVMFMIEIFTPTFGILTLGGIVSFVLGSLMLFDKAGPYFQLSMAVVLPAALLTAGFFAFVVAAGLRAQFRPVMAGAETLIGRDTVALSAINSTGGKVFIDGELWNAVCPTPIAEDTPVRIVGRKGLTLNVQPIAEQTRHENEMQGE